MNRDEAVKLLKGGPKGIAEWNRRREAGEEIEGGIEEDFVRNSLSGVDLSSGRLADADFRNVSLYKARLGGAGLVRGPPHSVSAYEE